MSLYSQRLLRILALFALSVLFLGLVRIEALAWNWVQFRHQPFDLLLEAFAVGARFDLAASAWLIAPLLLATLIPWPRAWERGWRTVALTVYLVIQLPFLELNMIDVEMVNSVGRRMTADVLFILGEAQGKMAGFLSTFALLFLIAFAVTAAFTWCAWRLVRWEPRRPAPFPSGALARGTLAFLLFACAVLFSRGGIQSKPISFVNANVFAAPALNNLVLNTSFNILKNLEQDNLPRVKYFDDRAAMMKNLNGGVTAPSLLDGHRPAKPQNVVILILESFGLQ